MSKCQLTAASLAALALFGAATSLATPFTRPVYTFIECEDNDFCSDAQSIDAQIAASATGDDKADEVFYITGRLQEDCIWDIQPKCALRVYGKPEPARDTRGNVILGQFCEPLQKTSDAFGHIEDAPVTDGAVRVAIAALQDAFDGTVNGLNNNGRHGEKGRVVVTAHYFFDGSDRCQEYVFDFINGSDAARVAFIVPPSVTTVDLDCDSDQGTVPICYDTDFYHVTGLVPTVAYCVTVIGGLNPACTKTDTLVGIFNKNCFEIAFNDDYAGHAPYSQVCTFSENDGSITIGVTGHGDADFNGLNDATQQSYFDFLNTLKIAHGTIFSMGKDLYRQGASACDCSEEDVIRYPRAFTDKFGQNITLWEDARYSAWFAPGNPPETHVQHGICGGYCLKVEKASHVPLGGSTGGTVVNGLRADLNSDGNVNASDLALLLSYWGPVQN